MTQKREYTRKDETIIGYYGKWSRQYMKRDIWRYIGMI